MVNISDNGKLVIISFILNYSYIKSLVDNN